MLNFMLGAGLEPQVTEAVAAVIADGVAMVTNNFLPILGVLGTLAGVNIGFKLFKRFTSKVG